MQYTTCIVLADIINNSCVIFDCSWMKAIMSITFSQATMVQQNWNVFVWSRLNTVVAQKNRKSTFECGGVHKILLNSHAILTYLLVNYTGWSVQRRHKIINIGLQLDIYDLW